MKILACPACHGDLIKLEKDGRLAFYCEKCDLAYPVEDEIPIMLVSEATSKTRWESGEK